MKKCPSCSAEMENETAICKNCGERIHDFQTVPSQADINEIEPSALKLCPSCHAFQDSKEGECPNCSYDLTDVEVYIEAITPPSLKAIVLTPLIYLFSPFLVALVIGVIIGLVGTAIGIPRAKLIFVAIVTSNAASFFIFLLMSIFLLKSYGSYFFSGSWKTNLCSRIKTGFKWSIPFIVVIGLATLVPEGRDGMLKSFLLMNKLSLETITIELVILISAGWLIATFLEELIFRGMIQRHIKKYTTSRISVLISAGIFTIAHLGHFFIMPVSLGNLVAWFVIGIFTGFAFNRYNSCISSFIPHLVVNLKFIIVVPLMLI
jgi:membrane protease YdiL (CAAX protease family)/RNA polymerase subunit RPABC4/transcription elongation factor Spt4